MTTSHTPQVFILTDASNLFYRQAKMTSPSLGVDSMVGMALHLIFNSMKKEYIKWSGTHTVFFLEGRSWRKSIYPDYKANRKVAFAEQSAEDQENHEILVKAFDELAQYIRDKTNITVLRSPNAEADDMIAIWVESHPDDQHVLISSDSDFFQLLKYPNVTLYDPVKDILIKRDGIYSDAGKKLEFTVTSTAKIKVGKPNPNFVCDPDWYNYALFLKCVRGDLTDNILSAYPGVREKGTKTSVGIREAYGDRNNRGYAWNNFMLQKYSHHDGTEHKVHDGYKLNSMLIDLGNIPPHIKQECLESIAAELNKPPVPAIDIGMGFLKFTGTWDLKKISDNSAAFMPMLKAKYQP